MKTKIEMFCMGALLLASCTQQDMYQSTSEIRLDAGGSGMSRVGGSELEYLSGKGDQIGIYGVVTEKTDATALLEGDWVESPLMSNVRTTGVDQVNGAVSWADVYNYPQESAKQVKFCAYHPYAPVGTSGENYVSMGVGRAPRLYFTLTGAEDVMVADPVIGSRVQQASALNFNHVLTQFRFQLVNADGFFSKEVSRIAFEGVNTRSSVDLETGTWGTWSAPSNAFEVASFEEPMPVTGTKEAPQKIDKELMLQPGVATHALRVNFGNGDENKVTIKPEGDTMFEAGKSYLITLKFSGKVEILASVSVAPWRAGASGGGVLD